MTSPIVTFSVRHYDNGKSYQITDRIIKETSVAILVNSQPVVKIACTSIHVEELALGFLKTEGIISSITDVEEVKITESPLAVAVITNLFDTLEDAAISKMSSGAEKRNHTKVMQPVDSDSSIPAQTILSLMEKLLTSSILHETTRGTHCSGIAEQGNFIALREDIGRHNTIDMLIGYSLMNKGSSRDQAIVTTGRISSEIVSKIWCHGAPIIISHSAPTSKAIHLAQHAGITLIGYVRGDQMKIYTHEKRVIF
ncbi:MAG: formate dehydrogenase accessory sulfurtransferase FdhD [Syntrophales bacterium]|jgi:FdhD protein|nr:formate dehydrogenase accessory sulfurtransferase FdhD [Syntrophales bacterium]MDY0043068.1 formate dehydrogenase accessory sulfurtransferase FdhD [Syntrophales bacterium]